MKTALILIALLVAFGVVGRMDYEDAILSQQERAKVASAEYYRK